MRAPNHWDTWLLEYDEASTEAELKGVGDFSDPEGVFRDFLDSVRKVAQNWADNFKQNQLNQPGMTRKEMMKRFREQMSDDYPKKTTQHHRGAFAVGGEEHSHDRSAFAAGGATSMFLIYMGGGASGHAQYLFSDDVLGQNAGKVPRHAKVASCAGMAIGYALFCWAVRPQPLVALAVAALLAGCAAWILRRPS